MQRRIPALMAVLAALMAQAPAQAQAEEQVCSEAGSTVEMSLCVRA
jgi:transcriptional regulator of nitric oxide reductase